MAVAIREKIREKAEPLLQPGERIEAVFPGQTANPMWGLVGAAAVLIKTVYRAVVVTDRRIIVCDTGRLSQANVKKVLRELPRSTKIGPASGLWHRTEALGERMWIHKRFYKDIEAADGA